MEDLVIGTILVESDATTPGKIGFFRGWPCFLGAARTMTEGLAEETGNTPTCLMWVRAPERS